MSIRFNREKQQFVIQTKHTTYAFSIHQNRFLVHDYYGKKIAEVPPADIHGIAFAPYPADLTERYSYDTLPQELSFFGSGDFRCTALRVKGKDGTGVTEFFYRSHRVFKGRRNVDGIPCAAPNDATKTLEIRMEDAVNRCTLYLFYTVFEASDVISRHYVLVNRGDAPVVVEKSMSMTLDLPGSDYDLISFYGRHNGERNFERAPLRHGLQSVMSRRGASSHQFNPFIVLSDRKTTEESGAAYGFNFVYSGSFSDEVEVSSSYSGRYATRVQVGLGDENFSMTVEPGSDFSCPEAVMTYTDGGLGQLARNFHDFTRDHILPPYAKEKHPVVLNVWEAVHFDIDEQLLFRFAEKTATMGVDILVMDDGWFGARNHDDAGLGDWFPNKRKFPNGLKPFIDGIHDRGMKFGIWIEPEMVNPDSDLYRAHPDWCLCVPGREPHHSRRQLVLDMANPAVIEYLKESFSKTFEGCRIDYFKWDMNRHMSDIRSSVLPPERQGEVPFLYMKNVYALMEWFIAEYPGAVIETCSGGGGRYDLAMMRYGFQIWTSDNTDPYARTMIQYSSMLGYPAATMSCHVSNPHGSMEALDFRYRVAVGGMLGYELNVLQMPDGINEEITRQIAEYRTFEHLTREGDYYPLVSPYEKDYAAYYYADREKHEFLLSVIETKDCRAGATKRLRLRGAIPGAEYKDQFSGKIYTGEELRAGISLPLSGKEFSATLTYLKKN